VRFCDLAIQYRISVSKSVRLTSAITQNRSCAFLLKSKERGRTSVRRHQQRGQPRTIRCDNGPELTSRHFLAWCVERQIEVVHIQPGKPTRTRTSRAFELSRTVARRVFENKLGSESV
jgi:transposase InsO family protein